MADTITRPDVATMPTADEIFRPAPVDPRHTRTRDLLSIGIDMITASTDDLAATCIERLCEHLADMADELAIKTLMLSESQTIAYERHVVITRQGQRIADLLALARGREQAS